MEIHNIFMIYTQWARQNALLGALRFSLGDSQTRVPLSLSLSLCLSLSLSSWSRTQAGVGLLRQCALPRLLHLFRALLPAATLAFAEEADRATLEAYEKLLTAKLTTTPQQTQTSLPTRLGGCGMLRFKGLRA